MKAADAIVHSGCKELPKVEMRALVHVRDASTRIGLFELQFLHCHCLDVLKKKTPLKHWHLHVRQSGMASPVAMQSSQVEGKMSTRIVIILEQEKAYCC